MHMFTEAQFLIKMSFVRLDFSLPDSLQSFWSWLEAVSQPKTR